MVDKIPGSPPPPQGPVGPTPTGPAAPFPDQSGVSKNDALASWKVMFRGQASDEEVKRCMDMVIKDAVNQMKKEEAKARELRKKLQREQEEG